MSQPTLRNGLTYKQEAFAQGVVTVPLSLSDAYRANYATDSMSDNALYVEASRLARHPKVSLRIAELQDRLAALADINLASVAAEMENARRVAENAEIPQVSAMIAASRAKANLVGLLQPTVNVNKRVRVELDRYREMEPDELTAFVEAQHRKVVEGQYRALEEGKDDAAIDKD